MRACGRAGPLPAVREPQADRDRTRGGGAAAGAKGAESSRRQLRLLAELGHPRHPVRAASSTKSATACHPALSCASRLNDAACPHSSLNYFDAFEFKQHSPRYLGTRRVSAPCRSRSSAKAATAAIRRQSQKINVPTPAMMPIATSAVTVRGARKDQKESAADRSKNIRPREPLHRSTCAPRAVRSIAAVPSAKAMVEVAHTGRGAVSTSGRVTPRTTKDEPCSKRSHRVAGSTALRKRAKGVCLLVIHQDTLSQSRLPSGSLPRGERARRPVCRVSRIRFSSASSLGVIARTASARSVRLRRLLSLGALNSEAGPGLKPRFACRDSSEPTREGLVSAARCAAAETRPPLPPCVEDAVPGQG